MGDPKRQRRKFGTPRHPWREGVLAEELNLVGLYGLRNKRELWRHKTELTRYRNIARSLLGMPPEKRQRLENELLTKLNRLGLVKENSTAEDVLDLTVQNILDRRLQTMVYRAGLAKTPHQARQLITHRHIAIGGRMVTSPSYLVSREEEELVGYSPYSPLNSPEHPLRRGGEAVEALLAGKSPVPKEGRA
ncbi:MAG: 30S ribosomal protein S4 [Candidatus Bathyarchaeia archaeon]